MTNLNQALAEKVRVALLKAYGEEKDLLPSFLEPEITQSTQAQFGHYQCNNALKLGKALQLNPRLVAEKIISLIDPSGISKLEVAGAGFINITLDASFLAHQVETLLKDAHLGIDLANPPQKIIVEFSSPNVAKDLHVGHLRSTIIGDALARLFTFLGHHVLRLNHIGDWGTQFGMLIAYMQESAPEVIEGKVDTDITSLMTWYKASKKKFDEDPEFKKRAQLEVVRLQGGNPESLKAWKMICAISRKTYNEIYSLLNVKIEERGESFYNPFLEDVVADLEKKGMITISDGAKCVFLEGFKTREDTPLPMIVQKADGGYNYDTTDMAAVRHRIFVEKADRIIVLTDLGQSLHFQMIIKACQKAGYLDPIKPQMDHVAFGVVLGADGKKFKTRSGKTEKLIDLLQEAVAKAKEAIKERLPDLSEKELEDSALKLGIGAVKYADLSCNRIKDYVFSYDKMLRFEGNTAPFLLYAYVRVNGIKRKVGKDIREVMKRAHITLTQPAEISLALHIRQFGEALDAAARELLPNRLTDYLYTLAEKFHHFFHECRVEGTPEEESRLLLCEATARVLNQGLNILGLEPLERM